LGTEGLSGVNLYLLKPSGVRDLAVLFKVDLNFVTNLSNGEVCKGVKESESRKVPCTLVPCQRTGLCLELPRSYLYLP